MVRHGGNLWRRHPGVKSGSDLTLGERAADVLKHSFGTWTFLFSVICIEAAWMFIQFLLRKPFDPYPYILLNLGLSTLAAMQGSALQISANRGDFISAQVADHTRQNTDRLIEMNQEILVLLSEVKHLNEEMDQAREREVNEMGTVHIALNTIASRVDRLDKQVGDIKGQVNPQLKGKAND